MFAASILAVGVLCLTPVRWAFAQNALVPETVSLCRVIANPNVFDGKQLRLKVFYRFGAEWSEIFCSNCWKRDEARVWVDFDPDFEHTTPKRIRQQFGTSVDAGTLSVTFVGRFSAKPSKYSHGGEYDFSLVAEKAEKAVRVSKDSSIPPLLDPKNLVDSECGC
jgi:hypothetical protein